jgi:hypothetical protein
MRTTATAMTNISIGDNLRLVFNAGIAGVGDCPVMGTVEGTGGFGRSGWGPAENEPIFSVAAGGVSDVVTGGIGSGDGLGVGSAGGGVGSVIGGKAGSLGVDGWSWEFCGSIFFYPLILNKFDYFIV